jgi:tetratricopeptide (TPR) repeat protein
MVSVPHKKGPFSAETEVAMAETHLQVALADPPPPNRDELIDLARARYQRALKQEPKNKSAWLGIARMYAKLGDKDRSVEAYDKVLKFYPKDHETLHELAVKRAQWKDWPGAIAACDAALKLDPDNRTYRKTLGFCQARSGKWDEALATLTRIMPEAHARYNLAGMLDHMGQPDACRQQLQLALQADPSYTAAKEFLNELSEGANPIQQAGLTQPQ